MPIDRFVPSLALALAVAASTVACGSSAAEEEDSDIGALEQLSDDTDPFFDVQRQGALCFGKAYMPEHMKSHPRQTVTGMEVQLFINGDHSRARVSFATKGADKARDLECVHRNGETWCMEVDECTVPGRIKIEKAAMGGAQGLRVFNKGGLRLNETCDRGLEVLKSESGGDDVFELPRVGSCNAN